MLQQLAKLDVDDLNLITVKIFDHRPITGDFGSIAYFIPEWQISIRPATTTVGSCSPTPFWFVHRSKRESFFHVLY